MQKNRKRKFTGKHVIVTGAMAAILVIGGASAYFTDTDTATNTWTVGKVDIELQEPGYDDAVDAKENENITPNEELTKDPKIENTGSNKAFVFMKVTVPKETVVTAAEDGTKQTAANKELFTFAVNNGWTQLKKTDGTDEAVYVFAYGSATELTELDVEQTTPVLFKDNKITFINVIENTVTASSLEVKVDAYGIQTTDITSDDSKDPEDVWEVLMNQRA